MTVQEETAKLRELAGSGPFWFLGCSSMTLNAILRDGQKTPDRSDATGQTDR
jgi:hypothetical protein